jgi:hypothetical protein
MWALLMEQACVEVIFIYSGFMLEQEFLVSVADLIGYSVCILESEIILELYTGAVYPPLSPPTAVTYPPLS